METTTTPKFNYTQNAWQGTKYDSSMSYADITKAVKAELKKMFPECKFSVSKESYAGGGSIGLSLMAAPFKVFNELNDEIIKKIEMKAKRGFGDFWENAKQNAINSYINETTVKMSYSINQFYINDDFVMTDKAKEVMTKALGVLQSYNFDDSDSQVDYFNTNFYVNASIGKWDKPFTLITK